MKKAPTTILQNLDGSFEQQQQLLVEPNVHNGRGGPKGKGKARSKADEEKKIFQILSQASKWVEAEEQQKQMEQIWMEENAIVVGEDEVEEDKAEDTVEMGMCIWLPG